MKYHKTDYKAGGHEREAMTMTLDEVRFED